MTDRHVVFLLADGGMEQMLKGFFGREKPHLRLGCGPFTHEVTVCPTKDPGVYLNSREWLRPYELRETHAVVLVDAEWEGSPGAEAISTKIARDLEGAWKQSAAIVLDPELEVWFWRDSPELGHVLNIPEQKDGRRVRDLLPAAGPAAWPQGQAKPNHPKSALEFLRRSKTARADKSNAVFARAGELSVRGCTDPSFRLLLDTLRTWFPPEYSS